MVDGEEGNRDPRGVVIRLSYSITDFVPVGFVLSHLKKKNPGRPRTSMTEATSVLTRFNIDKDPSVTLRYLSCIASVMGVHMTSCMSTYG